MRKFQKNLTKRFGYQHVASLLLLGAIVHNGEFSANAAPGEMDSCSWDKALKMGSRPERRVTEGRICLLPQGLWDQ